MGDVEHPFTKVDIHPLYDYILSMSIDQIKDEIKDLPPEELDQVAALILQIRRETDPDRKTRLSEMIDDEDVVAWKSATSG